MMPTCFAHSLPTIPPARIDAPHPGPVRNELQAVFAATEGNEVDGAYCGGKAAFDQIGKIWAMPKCLADGTIVKI